MANLQKISVLLIGIEEKEDCLLKGIFQLSQSRAREYQVIEHNEKLCEQFIYADIIIVDKDNLESIQKWKNLISKTSSDFFDKTVLLSSKTSTNPNYKEIKKPLIALRVLSALDNIQIQQHEALSEAVIQTDSKQTSPSPSGHVMENSHILVIDDSLPVRKHLEYELNKFNCHVDFAENAEDGLDLIQKTEYNLVFLDVVLPGMDGYELCKLIKRNKSLRMTPIVMLTSKSSPFDKVRGSLAGCDNYLTKPVDASRFHQIVEKYLQSETSLGAPLLSI